MSIAPGKEGEAGKQIGSSYSSAIPWVAVARAIGGAIDFGGGGASRRQRENFRAAGGTVEHKGTGRWRFTYQGQRVSENRAVQIARQFARGLLGGPSVADAPRPAASSFPGWGWAAWIATQPKRKKKPKPKPKQPGDWTKEGTYTNEAGDRYPNPPSNWKLGRRNWELLMESQGKVLRGPRLPVPVKPAPPKTFPSKLPPDFVTREIVADAYGDLGYAIYRELDRRRAEAVKREVDRKRGPKRRPVTRRSSNSSRPPQLDRVVVTSDRLPVPIVVESLPPIVPAPVITPGPAPTVAKSPWYSRIRLPKLSGSLSPAQLADLLLRGQPAAPRIKLRDPLTIIQNPALPSTATGSYFGGVTGTKSKTCTCAKPRRRSSKKKPREVCYRGTYTETSTGLRKRKARKVPCK